MFIFTEIWNRWSTEVELKQNKYYLLANPLHILTLLWQSSIHLLKDKNTEWSIFKFNYLFINMCNIIIFYTAKVDSYG